MTTRLWDIQTRASMMNDATGVERMALMAGWKKRLSQVTLTVMNCQERSG